MRLSCTVMEIWRLKDNKGHELDLLGSRDVIGHVTIRLPGVNFIWVVHSDHASILHRYGDMAAQILDARTWTRKEIRKKGKEKEEGEGKEKEIEEEGKGMKSKRKEKKMERERERKKGKRKG